MGAMLATTTQGLKLYNFIELIIVIGIAKAIKPTSLPAINRNIQAAKGKKHALRCTHFDIQFFNFDITCNTGCRNSNPIKAFITLIRSDDSAFRVNGKANPRSEFIFWNREKFFNLKAFRDFERRIGSACPHSFPS